MDILAFFAQVVLPLVGAIGGIGGAVAWYKARAERERIEAEREEFQANAAAKITQTALLLIAPLQQRLQTLEAELQYTRDELRQTRQELETANIEIGKLRNDVLAKAQARITELERALRELQEQNAGLRALIETLRGDGLEDDAA